MKGNSPLFGETRNFISRISHFYSYELKNNINPHKLPIKHVPNSTVIQKDDNGKVVRIRHYDENGNAYKDVDYTDHGNPSIHKVPHTHEIKIDKNNIIRNKGAKYYGSISI